MQYLLYVAGALAVLTSLGWVLMFGVILKQLFAAPKISEVDAPEPERFPSLSILVPACNEAESIEQALRALMEQDYPNMEVIAIDDRSTDGTGEIIDSLSDEYENLIAVHVTHLPDDWIGKTHALKKGYESVTGEWVLTMDADVCCEPGALRTIMSVALHEDLDQISCLPDMQNSGFLHELAFDGWVAVAVGQQNWEGIRDVDSEDYFALGAFNMFRRDMFEKTKKFSWFRLEIADDMAVAKLMRDQGAKQAFFLAFDELKLEWYKSVKGMIKGLEKNGIAVAAHYDYVKGVAIPTVWSLFFLGPFIGLLLPWTWIQAMGLGAVILSVPFNVTASRRLERPAFPYLFSMFGICIMMFTLMRSTYFCARRGGIEWRGTTYPVEKLREYQRVKF